jgi:hypothetical protein
MVQVFYPFSYENFTNVQWDLVLIEGWFPMVHDFIFLARVESPGVKIIYYCLDPIFPSVEATLSLDVDGYLTNSRKMEKILSRDSRTLYLPLAADAEVMKPNQTIPRDWDCIYIGFATFLLKVLFIVGAGGHMTQAKPLLKEMLLSCASEFRLRLHGSSWETSSEDRIKASWKGFLPRDEIAQAYNSAKVVLASTIREQAVFGMINNRIFEALACGSLVISDRFEALSEMFGDLIIFVNRTDEFQQKLRQIMVTPEIDLVSLRERARESILKYHTWDHRVISIFEFYTSLERKFPRLPSRAAKQLVAVIVHDELRTHGDYLFSIQPALVKYIHGEFSVQEFDQLAWESLQSQSPLQSLRFSIIVVVFAPYDSIHQHFLQHFHLESPRVVSGRNALQKIFCYIIGGPPDPELVMDRSPTWYKTLTDIFDVVLYRDSYEMELLIEAEEQQILSRGRPDVSYEQQLLRHDMRKKRWQHAFGIVTAPTLALFPSLHRPVAICWNMSMSLCTNKVREIILPKSAYTLMLIGGHFDDWLNFCNSESEIDCVLRDVRNPETLTTMLSRTVHFAHYQEEIFSLICSSQKVYLLFEIEHQGGSLRDQLWPLVLAAVCNRPIHFLRRPGPHLTRVISDGCDIWNEDYTNEAWKHAFERLHGLASSRSTISIVSNYQSGSTVTTKQLAEEPLVFQPKTQDFLPGRDGKICLHHLGESRICLIRDYLEFVILVPPAPPIPCMVTLNFTLALQSHLFADTIRYSLPFQIHICPSSVGCVQNTTPAPTQLLDREKVHFKIEWEDYSPSCPEVGTDDL